MAGIPGLDDLRKYSKVYPESKNWGLTKKNLKAGAMVFWLFKKMAIGFMVKCIQILRAT